MEELKKKKVINNIFLCIQITAEVGNKSLVH